MCSTSVDEHGVGFDVERYGGLETPAEAVPKPEIGESFELDPAVVKGKQAYSFHFTCPICFSVMQSSHAYHLVISFGFYSIGASFSSVRLSFFCPTPFCRSQSFFLKISHLFRSSSTPLYTSYKSFEVQYYTLYYFLEDLYSFPLTHKKVPFTPLSPFFPPPRFLFDTCYPFVEASWLVFHALILLSRLSTPLLPILLLPTSTPTPQRL